MAAQEGQDADADDQAHDRKHDQQKGEGRCAKGAPCRKTMGLARHLRNTTNDQTPITMLCNDVPSSSTGVYNRGLTQGHIIGKEVWRASPPRYVFSPCFGGYAAKQQEGVFQDILTHGPADVQLNQYRKQGMCNAWEVWRTTGTRMKGVAQVLVKERAARRNRV